MNDYKQKALETAHCQSDPLNIYILLADTAPVFITTVIAYYTSSKVDLHKTKVSGFPCHATGYLGDKRVQGQTWILGFLLPTTSCVICSPYSLFHTHMAIIAKEVKLLSWHIPLGAFLLVHHARECGEKNLSFLTGNGVDKSPFCLQVNLKWLSWQ